MCLQIIATLLQYYLSANTSTNRLGSWRKLHEVVLVKQHLFKYRTVADSVNLQICWQFDVCTALQCQDLTGQSPILMAACFLAAHVLCTPGVAGECDLKGWKPWSTKLDKCIKKTLRGGLLYFLLEEGANPTRSLFLYNTKLKSS